MRDGRIPSGAIVMANGGQRFFILVGAVVIIIVTGMICVAMASGQSAQIIGLGTVAIIQLLMMAKTEQVAVKTDDNAEQLIKTRHDLKNDLNGVSLVVQHSDLTATKTAQAVSDQKLGITLTPVELDGLMRQIVKESLDEAAVAEIAEDTKRTREEVGEVKTMVDGAYTALMEVSLAGLRREALLREQAGKPMDEINRKIADLAAAIAARHAAMTAAEKKGTS